MKSIPLGLQLYSVRTDCARDLPGTLSALAQMGYAGVEFAGYFDYRAPALKQMLVERGLQCCGSHTSLDKLLGDQLPRTIDFNLALGNRFVVLPSLPPERRNSRAAWLDTAKLCNDLSAQLKPHGLQLGYHNHRFEFEPLDGELPWDIFARHTDAAINLQLDMGHALEAGADPAAALRRYAGRAQTVHIADYSPTNPTALLGEGDVNWTAVFAACEQVGGTQWYIVEQEHYAYPPLECAARCLTNLRGMLS